MEYPIVFDDSEDEDYETDHDGEDGERDSARSQTPQVCSLKQWLARRVG